MSKYNHQQSSYCYFGTDTLKNKHDIRDPEALEKFERILSTWRISQLREMPIVGDFDLKHLQHIHEYMFQDIYSFAGELRTESIAKEQFIFALPHIFALPQYIQSQANELFSQ
ncbi:hypothetical protein [Paenibacillus wenxiniae]|uniref:protein adenylyltransferase n=1 Tax=Paenibacillus wenxiniae TaxID=1636843 RepID=A0ABW4RJ58_9BACL